LDRKLNVIKKSNEPELNILVIGHVYNLYDSFINMDLIDKLRKNGVKIMTIDMVEEDIARKMPACFPKDVLEFWKQAFGSVMNFWIRKI